MLFVTVTNANKSGLPQLEVVSRVAAIPIVGSGIEITEKVYRKVRVSYNRQKNLRFKKQNVGNCTKNEYFIFNAQESNILIRWYLRLSEKSLATGVQLALPAVLLFESPIHQLDRFLCKSLDAVGERVPSIYLPPQAVSSDTLLLIIIILIP